MSHPPPPEPLISVRDAARRLKLHRTTLQAQVNAGQVRSVGGKVRLSEVKADRANNISAGRPGGRKKGGGSGGGSRHPPPATRHPDPPLGNGESFAEAQRRKEIALANKHELDVRAREGTLVDRAGAEKLFFDTAREFRDAWIAWPPRVAVTMADEIRVDPATGKVDARSLTSVLSAHVHQHLTEMGEPDAPELEERR